MYYANLNKGQLYAKLLTANKKIAKLPKTIPNRSVFSSTLSCGS